MARKEFPVSQSSLSRNPSYSHYTKNYPIGKDINEFIISTLDPDNGSIQETLSLAGTHLPFQPAEFGVSQEMIKFYYPGGQSDRVPTMQVLGSMDDDVVLTGRFKATKIMDVNRRNEPLIISQILRRFIREGNVCFFQLGDWLKYGLLKNGKIRYKTDADIDWEITISVIGDKNPITGEDRAEEENAILRVFSSDAVEDTNALSDKINNILDLNRQELEKTYLPKINLETFSVKAYLRELLNNSPVGEVFNIGQDIYNGYVSVMRIVDNILDNVEEFVDIAERTSFNINKISQNIQSQISRLYKLQQDLFVSYDQISDALDPFTRLNALNAFSNLFNLSNNLLLDFSSAQDAVRAEQFSSIKETYVAVSGDTYQSISAKFYGTWQRWEELKNLNNYPDTLSGGEIFLIPE